MSTAKQSACQREAQLTCRRRSRDSAADHGDVGDRALRRRTGLQGEHENVYVDTSAYAAQRHPVQPVEFKRGHGRRVITLSRAGSPHRMINWAAAEFPASRRGGRLS